MDGFLLVDKRAGMTSHDVVDAVRRIANTRRVGHAGTLDPFATGLLILGINGATKKLADLVGLDKTYEAELTLGATSDTFDVEGVITPLVSSTPNAEEIERVLEKFRGGYEQKAPLHSAKKVKGKRLYELARAGTATEEMRPAKQVLISKLEIRNYSFPKLEIIAAVSSGTYIRSLADDIGRELGTGAYLTALRRTRIGTYAVEDAFPLEKLRETTLDKALIRC